MRMFARNPQHSRARAQCRRRMPHHHSATTAPRARMPQKRRSAQSTLVSQGTLGPGDPGGWPPAVEAGCLQWPEQANLSVPQSDQLVELVWD